ncbi:MAG: DUF4384 domain-containing protein [Candidatus Omnitrophica bacterium]|nr:DUF4384 domain-containing protein [bacterium]MCL4734356.1 DUF4384 domain-containing protein [Candidatus Omnitrophota bacterium]NUP92241.1 DUF4384 domain-containing protein [Candidatus Omnitrophota bacterium]
MPINKTLLTIVICLIVPLGIACSAEDIAPSPEQLSQGTRNLIFTPEGNPTPNLAVSLEVELLVPSPTSPTGRTWMRVPGTRVFATGEKVRFSFTSTQDAYAYLLCRNSDGTKVILWPNFQAGTNSFVRAGMRITIPQSPSPEAGWLFVDPPGTEELVLVLSRARLAKLDALVGTVQGRGVTDGSLTDEEFKEAEIALSEISTRNLLFVPEEGPQAPPYVISPNPAEPVKVKLNLRHGVASALPPGP